MDINTAPIGWFSIISSPPRLVSALFNFGAKPGTEALSRKDPANYLKWMEIFKSIRNPVVFFTDKIDVGRRMVQLRQELRTVVNIKH